MSTNLAHDYDAGKECGKFLTEVQEAGGEPARLAENAAGNILVSFVIMKLLGGGYEGPMSEARDSAKALLDILPPELDHGRQHLENMVAILSDHLAEQTKH